VASRVDGDFVECGVNAGFSQLRDSHLPAWPRLRKTFYLVETFDGPPLDQLSEAEVESGAYAKILESVLAGAYLTDLEQIRRNFAEWRCVEVVPGVAPDVLPSGPRISPGGIVLLDDYCRADHEPLGDAMDDLCESLGVEVLSLPTGQGLIVK
jgi:hypothetical protein